MTEQDIQIDLRICPKCGSILKVEYTEFEGDLLEEEFCNKMGCNHYDSRILEKTLLCNDSDIDITSPTNNIPDDLEF